MENELKNLISENEQILYEGRPDKKCFIFESIFNPLLPFALIWAIFDLTFIKVSFSVGGFEEFMTFIIPFFLFHLMPVWIYIGGIIFSFKKYKNTYYIVTDSGIYVSEGIFTKRFNHKPFAELSHVELHRGIFDQIFNVGDIITTTDQLSANNTVSKISLNSISNYVEVYNLVKKLQKDIYTDVMYPNDKRPKENHGYNTEYKG